MRRLPTFFVVVITLILVLSIALAAADPGPVRDSCDIQIPGDANSDGVIDTEDLSFMFDYIYNDGPPPVPYSNGDANCNCNVAYTDLEFLDLYLNHGGPAPCSCTCTDPEYIPNYCWGMCGDANLDSRVDISDAVRLINFTFGSGPGPIPTLSCGDANSDGAVDISDAIYIINFAFGTGLIPANCSPGSWLNMGGDCCPNR